MGTEENEEMHISGLSMSLSLSLSLSNIIGFNLAKRSMDWSNKCGLQGKWDQPISHDKEFPQQYHARKCKAHIKMKGHWHVVDWQGGSQPQLTPPDLHCEVLWGCRSTYSGSAGMADNTMTSVKGEKLSRHWPSQSCWSPYCKGKYLGRDDWWFWKAPSH